MNYGKQNLFSEFSHLITKMPVATSAVDPRTETRNEARERPENQTLPFAAALNLSSEAIIFLTLDGQIKYANRAAKMSFPPLGKNPPPYAVDLLNPPDRTRAVTAMALLRTGHSVDPLPVSCDAEGGAKFHLLLNIHAVPSPSGGLDEIVWIARNVSHKRDSELLRSLSRVVEQTADSVMITNTEGEIEYINAAFISTTGYSSEEAVGRRSNLLKSGSHSKDFYNHLWTTILRGEPFHSSMINKKRNGELYYVEKTITPLSDLTGKITHFVSTDKDVTDRRLAQQEMERIQRRFSELFNFSPDAMAYCTIDGTLIEVNEAFTTLTGYSREELVQKKQFQDISSQKCWDEGNKQLARILATGEPTTYEKEYIRKDKRLIPALVTAFPVVDSNSQKPVAVGTIIKDFTQLKLQQKKLETTSKELLRSNAELEQFACVAAHDLNQPLSTIGLYLQLIVAKKNRQLDEETKKYLASAVKCSQTLAKLIAALLTYSRVGTGDRTLKQTSMEETLETAKNNLREALESSGAGVQSGPLPSVVADPDQIVQLLQNLISNAVKYRSNEAPRICIEAARKNDSWLFSVRDNGCGIKARDLERVFKLFQRANTGENRPGTGIGLAICRRIVERRGGTIWVESAEGQGSVFFFTVPDELPDGDRS